MILVYIYQRAVNKTAVNIYSGPNKMIFLKKIRKNHVNFNLKNYDK